MSRKVDYVAADDADPWERQSGETGQSWEAFCSYMNMGYGRSLARVAESLDLGLSNVEKWSRRWNWVRRVAASEANAEKKVREAEIEALTKMRVRHLNFAQGLQRVGQYKLNSVIDAIEGGKTPEVSLDIAAKLLETGMKLERLFRGEPDSISQHTLDVGDRRKAIRRLLESKKATEAIGQLTDIILDEEG